MNTSFLCIFFLGLVVNAQASGRDSTRVYPLPDSVKAVQFMATISVQSVTGKKESFAGIRADGVSLVLEAEKEEKEIVFQFPENATVLASGRDVEKEEDGELEYDYNWAEKESYQLMIAVASDSAGNFSLYSGYAWLPKDKKWKLIGTCRINGRWGTLKEAELIQSSGRKGRIEIQVMETWCQRSNGSWKNLDNNQLTAPVINYFGHADSSWQHTQDTAQIGEAIRNGKTDALHHNEGVYYTIMREGTGRPVYLTDTVEVYYKGYLLNDGSIFDQTLSNPARFPLRRLIRGWQIGVPLCKTGGKIKLVIPSGLAYSIRTRAAKIPPNSILVFEIEVVKAIAPHEEK